MAEAKPIHFLFYIYKPTDQVFMQPIVNLFLIVNIYCDAVN